LLKLEAVTCFWNVLFLKITSFLCSFHSLHKLAEDTDVLLTVHLEIKAEPLGKADLEKIVVERLLGETYFPGGFI
jgi:hypothetical protein